MSTSRGVLRRLLPFETIKKHSVLQAERYRAKVLRLRLPFETINKHRVLQAEKASSLRALSSLRFPASRGGGMGEALETCAATDYYYYYYYHYYYYYDYYYYSETPYRG